MPLLVAALLEKGLSLLGNAVLAKGQAVVEEKLGVKLPADGAPIDDELALKLKQLEIDHEEYLLDIGIQQAEQELKRQAMAYADTASARDMNTRTQESVNASWLSKNIVPILALIVIVGGGILFRSAMTASLKQRCLT